MNELVRRCIEGDIRAAARLITLLENQDRDVYAALYRLKDHSGRAQIIGITGPPGAGKSTLVDKLITQFRARGLKVGVLAVDPRALFPGGRFWAIVCACRGTRPIRRSLYGALPREGASAASRRRRTRRSACSTLQATILCSWRRWGSVSPKSTS